MVQIIKHRYESDKLKCFRALNSRMDLSEKDFRYYLSLQKGFEGEKKFDKLTEKLPGEWLILNDLLLEYNGTKAQIDSMLISQFNLFPMEVKNLEGDYYLEGERMLFKNGDEVKNPLLQVQRSKSHLRQILQHSVAPTFPVEPYLIFIHPEFHLYEAPSDFPIVYPTQINRFMKKLQTKPTKLNPKHKKLCDQLLSYHVNEDFRTKLPVYDYRSLRKGIRCSCGDCSSFMRLVGRRFVVCPTCQSIENVDAAVLRSVAEYRLLFPTGKITTNVIYDWCGRILSLKTIRRILSNNFIHMKHAQISYFIEKDN